MPARRPARLAAAALLAAGCGAERAALTVGCKDFTEQLILGHLAERLLHARLRIPVERRFHLGGTMMCHAALRRGDLDVYPEYTGTIRSAILKLPGKARSALETHREARTALAARGILVLAPLGFNNTYALMMRSSDAKRLGVARISDLVPEARGLRAAFTSEFMQRADGWPGLADTYRLAFRAAPRQMDPGLMYGALASGDADVISGFATDGRIARFKLRVLEDDREFFPPYEACYLVNAASEKRWPGLRAALDELAGLLNDHQMRALNAAVDVDGRNPAEVADRFLRSRGLIR